MKEAICEIDKICRILFGNWWLKSKFKRQQKRIHALAVRMLLVSVFAEQECFELPYPGTSKAFFIKKYSKRINEGETGVRLALDYLCYQNLFVVKTMDDECYYLPTNNGRYYHVNRFLANKEARLLITRDIALATIAALLTVVMGLLFGVSS